MQEISKEQFNQSSSFSKSRHADQVMFEAMNQIEEVGEQKFLHGAGFNKKRELFIASLFSYAIRRWSKREWFIQDIPKEESPDFYFISPADDLKRRKPVDRLGIELVEIRDIEIDLAIKTIERTKLKNYFPAEGTILLMFFNSGIGLKKMGQINIWIINNKDKFSRYGEVYILFIHKFSTEVSIQFSVANCFKLWSQTCNLIEEYNKGIIFPHPLIEKYRVKIIN